MKYFIKYCFYCLIIPIIIVTINVVIDYRQLVNPFSSFIEELVNDLEHNNLVYYMNTPERRIVKKRIETSIKGLNNISIGSSNSMSIGKENGFNYINLGVSGFVTEDISYLYELINYNNVIIDTLIIGVDSWLLNKYHGSSGFHLFEDGITKNDLRTLFSIRYLYDNLRINKYKIWNGDTTQYIRFSDGSIKYSFEFRNKRWGEKDFILNYVKGEIYHLNNFIDIDPNYLMYFEKSINQFREISNHTILLLNPYHPLIFDELLKKVPIIKSVENKIYKIFKNKEDITIKGSFNPNLNRLEYSDFYDGMHPSELGLKKYFINYKPF